jgi:hypothetical protein
MTASSDDDLLEQLAAELDQEGERERREKTLRDILDQMTHAASLVLRISSQVEHFQDRTAGASEARANAKRDLRNAVAKAHMILNPELGGWA